MAVDDILCRVHLKARVGRRTQITSPDKTSSFDLAIPARLGGTDDRGITPEHLFAGCLVGSFMTMLRLVSARTGIRLPRDTEVEAELAMWERDESFRVEVELTVRLPGLARVDANLLSAMTYDLCPYTRMAGKVVAIGLVVL
jgi:lipoyl-dependent peroxiredoxin